MCKRRWMAVIAALTAAAMTLMACGSTGSTASSGAAAASSKGAASESEEKTDSSAADTGAEASDAEKADGKVYMIATDTTFAPFEFENEEGQMVGIDLDLLQKISELEGFDYELQLVGFSAAMTALEAGEVDGLIAGMSITDERKAKYDFSDSYFDSGIGMAVLADADIDSYDDLKGKQVAAKIGSEGCKFAESIKDKYGFTIAQFEDSATMYQDVLSGTSAAVFDDYPVLGYEIKRGIGFKMPLPMERSSSYGFAVLKGSNAELLQMFNDGLKQLKEDGTYDEIIKTYISD